MIVFEKISRMNLSFKAINFKFFTGIDEVMNVVLNGFFNETINLNIFWPWIFLTKKCIFTLKLVNDRQWRVVINGRLRRVVVNGR